MPGITLGIRGWYWSALGLLWIQLWHMRLTVGHFGVNLGSLWDGLGRFDVTFVSLCALGGRFGISLG